MFASPERFEHEYEMVLMCEVSEHSQAVILVVRICIIQFLKNLKFLHTLLVPEGIKEAAEMSIVNLYPEKIERKKEEVGAVMKIYMISNT